MSECAVLRSAFHWYVFNTQLAQLRGNAGTAVAAIATQEGLINLTFRELRT